MSRWKHYRDARREVDGIVSSTLLNVILPAKELYRALVVTVTVMKMVSNMNWGPWKGTMSHACPATIWRNLCCCPNYSPVNLCCGAYSEHCGPSGVEMLT